MEAAVWGETDQAYLHFPFLCSHLSALFPSFAVNLYHVIVANELSRFDS